MVVAGLIVWGASHFVGAGFILDITAVVVMGLAVLKAFQVMWDIYKIISGTAQKSDLERAAKMMANMVIDLGVETFLAIVLKGVAKSRFRAPPNKATGSADEVSSTIQTRKLKSKKNDSDVSSKKKSSNKKAPPPTKAQLETAKREGLDPKWVKPNGKVDWPPNDGFAGTPKTGTMNPPATFDRYGGYTDPKTGQFKDGGKFTSPRGVPKEQRAVTPATLKKPHMEYRVIKPIPDVKSGKIAPWFDQPGGGTQHLMPKSVDDLLKGGYIEPIG